MPKTPSNDDQKSEQIALGRAVQILREAQGMTQQQAADRAQPSMTAQNWGMHETGKVAGIERQTVLRRLADAIGVTVEDIQMQRARIAEFVSPTAAAKARLRAVAGGLGEHPAEAYAPGLRRAVFPLSEGDAVLTFPDGLSDLGFRELTAYMSVFLATHGQPLNGELA